MPFISTGIPDLMIFEPAVFGDDRGYFFESYNENIFIKEGKISIKFVQDNQARSVYGVVRGLHFQHEPFTQTKLIRVLKENILYIAINISKGSLAYGKV